MSRLALIALAGAAGARCRLGTFSTFALKAVTLPSAGRMGLAAAYVGGSVALGLAAAAVGQLVGRWLS